MSFEKGDRVVLHDEHSEYDGEVGTVEQVSETMFGDETFVISFEEGQEAGIAEDALEAGPDDEAASDEAASPDDEATSDETATPDDVE